MSKPSDSKPQFDQSIEAMPFDAPDRVRPPSPSNATQQPNLNTALLTREGAPWWHSQFNLMLCVFGLLAVAAVLFISLTPEPAVVNRSTIVEADGSTRLVAPESVDDTVAPFDESQRVQARADSQAVLADLLETKKALEEKNVKVWAAVRFDAALARATEGDEAYKRQEFTDAINLYRSALNELESLNELIPQIVASRVAAGNTAIQEGKSELARTRFSEALQLDANNLSALTGLDRAKNLDEVLESMRAAGVDEQIFNTTDEIDALLRAKSGFEQALALDANFLPAQESVGRIDQALEDKRYRDAMTEGYNALFAGRYAAAKQGFSKALKIRAGDDTARAAYQQSLASDTRSSLSSLLSNAARYEKSEEWDSALSNYREVLQRDPNQVNAKLGQIRSGARAQLDAELEEVLKDPLALARQTQRERATQLLRDAKGIKSAGPLLKQQVAQLDKALTQVDKTVTVALKSDDLTQVRLSKAGANTVSLGQFKSKRLALAPGRYVVLGTRLGFRDVRQELELRGDGSAPDLITIACTEPVASRPVSNNNP